MHDHFETAATQIEAIVTLPIKIVSKIGQLAYKTAMYDYPPPPEQQPNAESRSCEARSHGARTILAPIRTRNRSSIY